MIRLGRRNGWGLIALATAALVSVLAGMVTTTPWDQ